MDIFALIIIIIGSSNVLVFYHCIKILETIKLEGGKLLTQHLVSVTFLGPVVFAFAFPMHHGGSVWWKNSFPQRQSKEGRKGCSPSAPFKPHPQ